MSLDIIIAGQLLKKKKKPFPIRKEVIFGIYF